MTTIPPRYGNYTTTIRPGYGLNTATIQPQHGHDTAPTPLISSHQSMIKSYNLYGHTSQNDTNWDHPVNVHNKAARARLKMLKIYPGKFIRFPIKVRGRAPIFQIICPFTWMTVSRWYPKCGINWLAWLETMRSVILGQGSVASQDQTQSDLQLVKSIIYSQARSVTEEPKNIIGPVLL